MPREIWIDPASKMTVAILLEKEIPPIVPPKDTKYIKHVRIQSGRLTKFWGRPMFLGANVLLPEGFSSHPQARYPLMIYHGHFPFTFGGFSEVKPDTAHMKGEYSERFHLADYNKIEAMADLIEDDIAKGILPASNNAAAKAYLEDMVGRSFDKK